MKPDHQVRFVIIGFGNLMEVIWHCLAGALGGEDLAGRAAATTADAGDIDRKRSRFGIPFHLGENLPVLKNNRPDIIFFAPPPTVAPALIQEVLKPYVAWVRETGGPLPEIYAFPPLPKGARYREVLGEDLQVVNIIPNNVSRIAGKPVTDEGYYVCTYPAPWPPASKERLQRIFASQGAYVEVDPDQLIPMLGGTCTFFSLWLVVPALADILADAGHAVPHNAVGELMRAQTQALSGYRPESGDPARTDILQGSVADYLDAVSGAWWEGVGRFFEDIAFPAEAARTIRERGFDLILHTTQCEPREVLVHHAVGAATKGGVLEKATATFRSLTEPVLREGAARMDLSPAWRADLTEKVRETAHIVRKHGLTLAG